MQVGVPRDAVKIQVENGRVTLSGEVDWHYQKEDAERHIHGLYGVVGVLNETTIRSRVDTTNIGHKIDHALHRSWFDPKTITVTAQGSKVKLTGSVDTLFDRRVAGATAWGAPGATEVENDLIMPDHERPPRAVRAGGAGYRPGMWPTVDWHR